jgi:hypothetical protein
MRRPCQDVERTIPSRLLHRQALPVACVSHIGRFTLRSPHHAATRIDREDDRAPGIRTHRQNDLHYRPLLDDILVRSDVLASDLISGMSRMERLAVIARRRR